MGKAEEIGKNLNKIHKPTLDFKLFFLLIILIGFSVTNCILREISTKNNYITKMIIYLIIGTILSIGIYFLDYKKIKKYSNLVYLSATILMILPILGISSEINGVRFISIFGITFRQTTIALPLYIISFIGFISDYDKNSKIKISINDKEICFKKDITKIIILSLLSICFNSLEKKLLVKIKSLSL